MMKHKFRSLILSSGLLLAPLASADDLQQIYSLASDNDPTIREARAQYNANHTFLTDGRAQLLPSVTLSGNTARNTQAATRNYSYANGFNTHSYSLNITQNLLNFEAWYNFQSVQEADSQAVTNLAIAEQELIIRVASAYFDVLRSQDNLTLFQAEEDAAEQVMQQSQQRFDVGLAAITDVYDSQAGYSLARVNRLEAENTLQQRFEALEAITGDDHQALDSLSEDFPVVSAEPDDLTAWIALAQENNLAMRAAEYDLAARQNTARAAKAAMLPTLSLNANYNDIAERANSFAFLTEASNSSSISLSVSMPLFRGGANRSRMERAYYTRDASREVLLRVERQGLQDTRNSYRSVETGVLTVEARQQAITFAESALDATETGVQVGTRNVVDLVQAQRTLYQALRDHANARYDYIINTLNLKRAGGILNPQDVVELNEWLE